MKKIDFCDIMGEIQDSYILEAHMQRKPGAFTPKRWGAIAACIAAILAVLVGLPHIRHSIPSSGCQEQTKLAVNRLREAPMSLDMDVQITRYSPLEQDAWAEATEAFGSFTGTAYDSFVSRIPGSLRENLSFCSLAARERTEYRLHDYVFECKSAGEISAVIAVCSFEPPLRDCLITEDAAKQSSINGTAVTVFEYGGMFLAYFSRDQLYYDIETKGMDLEQFQQLLADMLA